MMLGSPLELNMELDVRRGKGSSRKVHLGAIYIGKMSTRMRLTEEEQSNTGQAPVGARRGRNRSW